MFQIKTKVFILNTSCLFLARQSRVGHGLFIHEITRSHTTRHHSR